MSKKPLIALFTILLTTALLPASSEKAPSAKNFFERILSQQTDIWEAPFRKENWKRPAPYLAIGLSGASFGLDDAPSRALRENEDFIDFNELLASRPADLALSLYPLAVVATGYISGTPRISEYGWKASEAALNAYLVTLLLKAATQRDRPHTGKIYGFWEGGNSFPSGHSAAAFSIAAVTSKHFSEAKWVPWVLYPIAGTIALSRVSSGNHYFSDAVTGSGVGFLIGYFGVD